MSRPTRAAGLALLALLAVGSTAGHAQSKDGAARTLPPAGSSSVGSGIPSEPPGTGIGGNNMGSMGSTGGQGTSGGNMESGGGRSTAGPTGSGSPGTGAGSAPSSQGK